MDGGGRLIKDLKARGGSTTRRDLTTEFAHAACPAVKGRNRRPTNPLLYQLAGGGVSGGGSYGQSDNGSTRRSRTDYCTISATVLHLLGIDQEK